jgi:uncharacterized protein YbjT (DUF2867 family)
MKVIIFGATGSVGKVLVDLALNSGHTVTAFTRKPQAFQSNKHPNLIVRIGDLENVKDVKEAIIDHDVVFCVIGDGGKGNIRAVGTRNIIQAMELTGVRRLICQTTLGLGESRANLDFFWKHIMFGLLLKKAYRDHQLQEDLVRKSKVDWIIVRPGAFTNKRINGGYHVGFDGSQRGLKLKISREELAEFLLKQATSDRYLYKEVSISS